MRVELTENLADFLGNKDGQPNPSKGNVVNRNTLRSTTGDCRNMEPGKLSRACKAFSGDYEPKIYSEKSISLMAITKKEVRNFEKGRRVLNRFGKEVQMGKMQIVKKADIKTLESVNLKKIPLEPKGTLAALLGGI